MAGKDIGTAGSIEGYACLVTRPVTRSEEKLHSFELKI